MSKRAILRCDGCLESGFGVILEIRNPDASVITEVTGALPPAIELLPLLAAWQRHYRGSVGVTRISLENIDTCANTCAEIARCRQVAQELAQALKAWLASGQFQSIEQRLRETLTVQESVELLLRTNDRRLDRLPWHLWDFIERYPRAEFSIGSAPESIFRPQLAHHRVKILAILGDCQGIDIEADRQLLAQLDRTDVVFLVEPSRQEVYSQLWEQAWDVLFFAGHSHTERQQGRIQLSGDESLTIEELRYGLRRSIGRGLQLAIFNSCDGLGLAYELEQLHLPHSIVMREPVPDRVALTFLNQFLSTFAGGEPLHTAVRQAREYLQGLEGEFPCASWLPVTFQNPSVPTLTWQNLQGNSAPAPAVLVQNKQPQPQRQLLLWTIVMSFAVTGLTIGMRYLGLLQAWELNAWDTLIRLRPAEKPDPRLLIVTVTEADVGAHKRSQEASRGSLSDESLAKLVAKLTAYRPIAIGLDIYRDYPVNPAYPALAAKMKSSDSPILGVCKVSELAAGDTGVAPPPEISPERLGFSDVLYDPDRVVRRHYLAFTPPTSSSCQASYGLSVQLALRYLATKNIGLEFTPQSAWKLGKLTFPPLEAHSGGYQKIDALGHQILLNYRSTPTPLDLAATVTMADVFAGKLRPEQVKDRLILIGTTAHSFHDDVLTPYTTVEGNVQAMPGVILQAQMVSQLLAAALDGRALIRSGDFAQDALWIWGYALIGGLLVIWLRQPMYLLLGTGIVIGILSGACLILLQSGYWVPLIPTAIGILGTECTIVLIIGVKQETIHVSKS